MSVSCSLDSTCLCKLAQLCWGVNMQSVAMPGYSHRTNEVEYTSL